MNHTPTSRINPRPRVGQADPHAGQARAARRRVGRRTATVFGAVVLGAVLAQALGVTTTLGTIAGWWLLSDLLNRYFFRDPNPRIPAEAGGLLAPAHGRVDCIEETHEAEFIQGRSWRISIFLSVLDVHVQHAPVAGRIALVRHQPGRYWSALRTRSAQQNENVLIGIESRETPGGRVVVRQVAGALARRIESWVQPGEEVARGQRLGMIRYGSRCDLYVPRAAQVLVQLGDHVRGGETIVAQGPAHPQAAVVNPPQIIPV